MYDVIVAYVLRHPVREYLRERTMERAPAMEKETR
jgi:hypothetical protein